MSEQIEAMDITPAKIDVSENSECGTELTNEMFVRIIKNLPDLLMECSGLLLPWHSKDEKEQKFLNGIREVHRSHADWLQYYLLNKVELLPELTFTRKVHFKPYAERSMSSLKFLQEVFLRSEDAQEQKLEPLWWLLCIEIGRCDRRMKNSYYAPKSDSPLGKSRMYQQTKNHYDVLQQVVGKAFQPFAENEVVLSNPQKPVKLSPEYFLEYEAARIASTEVEFRNTYYQTYSKEQKRYFRQIRDDKQLHLTYMTASGEIQEISNGSRGHDKTKRKSKGFEQI